MRPFGPRSCNIWNSTRINRYSLPRSAFLRASNILARRRLCVREISDFPHFPFPFLPAYIFPSHPLFRPILGYTVTVCGCHAIRTYNNAVPGEFRKHNYSPLPKSRLCRCIASLISSQQNSHARYALRVNISSESERPIGVPSGGFSASGCFSIRRVILRLRNLVIPGCCYQPTKLSIPTVDSKAARRRGGRTWPR